jgi:SAM-dependent methyltransferase
VLFAIASKGAQRVMKNMFLIQERLLSPPMHLEKAHALWKEHLRPTDTAIDATCGNGKDTLVLARLLPEGHLFALDIQPTALENTQKLLETHLPASQLSRIHLLLQSHACLPTPPNLKLIVYNLGYLPGGNKNLTTQTASTLESFHHATELLPPGGAISLTTYPGHPEGLREHQTLLPLLHSLTTWQISPFSTHPTSPHLVYRTQRK